MEARFALGYLRQYVALLDDVDSPTPSRDAELIAEDIMRAQPTLRRLLRECGEYQNTNGQTPASRQRHREAILRAEGAIRDREAVRQAFAPAGPQLAAQGLHPWVWETAAPLWSSKHYRQAVAAAAGNLSLKVQAKLDRWDVADDALMTEALSDRPPAPGRSRLRVPATHNVTEEWSEQRAVEALAAMSVLARLLDAAEVVRVD